ncbi:ATP-binding protein [Actinotalea ferrariae]|uniref:ATP-binding protein n=1 Tax=Actinotalea ferrariae TaxID=1386098 RepID=UPI001C8B5C01|nr:ATP-binding protein [Actinotalea ferrariae]MBX9245427.1 ATP-binding protein [Actinotalea ferrariae]
MSQPAEPAAGAVVGGGPEAVGLGTVTLPAEPSSVPHARRFVQDALVGQHADVVDRAEACISELVTNAVLHARTEIRISVEDLGDTIRLDVRDRSTAMPRRLVHTVRSATGRGMEMVGLLARSWGVDLLEGDAKSVWCELGVDQDADTVEPPDPEALLAAWPDDDELLMGPWEGEVEPVLPRPRTPSALESRAAGDGARTFTLVGYPVRLGILAREHTSGILRECALLSQVAATTHAPAQLVALAGALTGSYSGELTVIDQQRSDALARGDATVDLVYTGGPGSTEMVLAWQSAMEALDAFAETSALLSLTTPPRLVALRDWMTQEMVRQSQGAEPRPWTGDLE